LAENRANPKHCAGIENQPRTCTRENRSTVRRNGGSGWRHRGKDKSRAALFAHSKTYSCIKVDYTDTIIVMVEIYLNLHGSQVSFLSIPDSDVQRLSIRPFKWLRYVMFSICGARGDLSATPDGPPVDYGGSLADNVYYYSPSGKVSSCMRDCCSPQFPYPQRIASSWTIKL
jgi:hypothetical protein